MSVNNRVNWSRKEEKIVARWILILLAINDFKPIQGRLRLIKILFRIAKEVNSEFDNAAYFYPYTYGPYSSRVGLKMNDFRKSGTIEVRHTGRDWEYFISSKSKKQAENYLSMLSKSEISTIEDIKANYGQMSSTEIVKDIYQKYRSFTKHSAIARDILNTRTIDPKDVEEDVDESQMVAPVMISLNDNKEIEEDEDLILSEWPDKLLDI